MISSKFILDAEIKALFVIVLIRLIFCWQAKKNPTEYKDP